jgi:copper chaperone CopZ
MKFVLLIFIVLNSAMAKDIKIIVDGMVCSMCAQGVKKKFKEQENISGVKVNLDNRQVHIITKGDHDLSDELIQKVITEAGYKVESIERK